MNLFRKRYTPNTAEDLTKNQNEVKYLEAAMRGIHKALESYIPYYQAIAQLNRALAMDLTKFYEKYSPFKEVSMALTETFRVENENIENMMKKIAVAKLQFNAWFLNFDVIKDLWKKYDTAEQNFLHYDEKVGKLKGKSGQNQETVIGNEKKLAEAKNVYDSVTLELSQLTDKIVHLSYTVVNNSLSEYVVSKANYHQEANEQYKRYNELPNRLTALEHAYLSLFEGEGAEGMKSSATSSRFQMLKVQNNMVQDPVGERFNPFQALQERNKLPEIFKEYKNNFAVEPV